MRPAVNSLIVACALSGGCKKVPQALTAPSLADGSFTTFLVSAECAPDDTPLACDPPVAYPVGLAVHTNLLGTFTPSDAMCGPFELEVHVDKQLGWAGSVAGGGRANAVGPFLLGEFGADTHMLTATATASDPCYGDALRSWFGTFTVVAAHSGAAAPAPAVQDEAPTAPAVEAAVVPRAFVTCEPCHGARAEGKEALNAPTLAGQEPWYLERQIENFRSGRRGTHDSDLYGMQMRPMALELASDDKVRAIVAYVSELQPPERRPSVEGDVDRGADLFLVCAVCHGDDGGGNEELGAPRLTVQQDWYLVRQILNFKDGLRGYHADDRYGQEMLRMTGTLEDKQAIRDVVAYIHTLEGVERTPSPAPPSSEPAAAAAPEPAPAQPAAPEPAAPAPATADRDAVLAQGKRVYVQICSPCHQTHGGGVPGAFPPLAGAGSFYGSPEKQAGIIINGLSGPITVLGTAYDGVMPPQGSLSDEDIAAVATYVRNSWGNSDGDVTAADVAAARQQ